MSDLDPRTALVQDYIMEERRRCLALVSVLHAEPDFLIHCIDYSVQPIEVESRRKRFEEMIPVPVAAAAVDDELEALLS